MHALKVLDYFVPEIQWRNIQKNTPWNMPSDAMLYFIQYDERCRPIFHRINKNKWNSLRNYRNTELSTSSNQQKKNWICEWRWFGKYFRLCKTEIGISNVSNRVSIHQNLSKTVSISHTVLNVNRTGINNSNHTLIVRKK